MAENTKKSELVNDFSDESEETEGEGIENGTHVSSSIGFVPEETKDMQTLDKSGDKANFLLKVGILFVIYFLMWSTGIFARIALKTKSLVFVKIWFYIVIVVFILIFCIKFAFGIFGKYMRKLTLMFYLIDCLLIFTFVLGVRQFYLRMHEKDRYYLTFLKPYINLAGANGLFSSIGFCVSTFFKTSKGGYNPLWGLLFVIPPSFISIVFFPWIFKKDTPRILSHVITFYVVTVLINIYFVVDMWLISKVRMQNFLVGDFPLAFFSVWFDWTYKFWRYMFTKPEIVQDMKIDDFEFGDNQNELEV